MRDDVTSKETHRERPTPEAGAMPRRPTMTPLMPSLPRTPWINLCALQLIRLRPDVPAETLLLVATLLWNETPEVPPQEAAALEAREWSTCH
jgi:hypothetical protein